MSDKQSQIRAIEEKIRQNDRQLNNPYEQDKWVERENNQRLQSELDRMRR